MAKRVEKNILGVDVAKQTLDICDNDGKVTHLANRFKEIASYFDLLDGPAAIAVEPTGGYQDMLVNEALRRGYAVYLINPDQLVHYRRAVNVRSKTDALDAQLLQRYLSRERSHLKPENPRSNQEKKLLELMHARALVMAKDKDLSQGLARYSDLAEVAKSTKQALKSSLKRIDQKINKLVGEAELDKDIALCLSVPGIGRLNAIMLTLMFRRGEFSDVDNFIAFLGLDVRERKSGSWRGREHISKKGDPEVRRLLYSAAMAANRTKTFKTVYERYIARGMSRIQANVALARKLARIVFALLKKQMPFDDKYRHHACIAP